MQKKWSQLTETEKVEIRKEFKGWKEKDLSNMKWSFRPDVFDRSKMCWYGDSQVTLKIKI
jgi:hypothetical protein